MHAHPASFWLALVPCAVAGALAIGIAISALCANIAVSAAAADAQSSYQFANLSAKGDRLSLPSDHLDTKPHETVRSSAARWL